MAGREWYWVVANDHQRAEDVEGRSFLK